jgi:hypothetical protein
LQNLAKRDSGLESGITNGTGVAHCGSSSKSEINRRKKIENQPQ